MLNGLVNGAMSLILRQGLRRYRPTSLESTALVLVHVQPPFLVEQDGLNDQLRRLISVARAHQIPVFWAYFQANDATNVPPPAIKMLQAAVTRNDTEDRPTDLYPVEGEIVLAASTALSAFYRTGLSDALKSAAIERLILAGAFADLSIDSTARDATEYDFHTTVISDCCGSDTGEGLHVALEITLPRLVHDVIPLDTWLERIDTNTARP